MLKQFDITGKVILITGASSGLGQYFATLLAAQGAKVIITGRRFERLKQLAKKIKAEGGVAFPFALDVRKASSINGVIKKIENKVGQIDVLINNAGLDIRRNFLDHKVEDWDLVFDTNLRGLCLMAQAVAKHMLKYKVAGKIINVSSGSARMVWSGGSPAYMASKAAVSHFTVALANELAPHKIQVNAIAPGGVDTEATHELFNSPAGKEFEKKLPLGRYSNFSDLAGPLLLLVSDASAYMLGEIIHVDGGMSLNRLSLQEV